MAANMRIWIKLTAFVKILTTWLMLAIATPVYATSLQVAPVLVDVPASGVTSRITLKNNGSEQIKAQIRIFKWVQKNGKDELVPTRDVVASPPLARISPNSKSTVRVVRISKSPLNGEEAYRLIVDQLPQKSNRSGVAVKLQIRYSIPVFFGANAADEPNLVWTAKSNGSKLTVKNKGNRHIRLSELKIQNSKGQKIGAKHGLVGYVLRNSTAKFDIKLSRKAKKNTKILITADGQSGQIRTKSRVH